MVCYTGRATWIAGIALVALVIYGRSADHFLDGTALAVALTIVAATAAAAAVLVFLAFRSTRRRRALAGGCVACRLSCQHAMTAQPSRLRLVSIVDRRPTAEPGLPRQEPAGRPVMPAAGRAGATSVRGPAAALGGRPGATPPGRPAPARSPVPLPAPRWPDRPIYRTDTSEQPAPG
jgi:hypothetical protein